MVYPLRRQRNNDSASEACLPGCKLHACMFVLHWFSLGEEVDLSLIGMALRSLCFGMRPLHDSLHTTISDRACFDAPI